MRIELTASDGVSLSARVFVAKEPRGAVLVVRPGRRRDGSASTLLRIARALARGAGLHRHDLRLPRDGALASRAARTTIVPFAPNRARAAKIVTIAAGSGYWRENAAPLRRKVWILWWGAVPLATPLFGYFPGRMLGMVGDLPKGVIAQWRKWCLDRSYAVGAEGPEVEALFADVTTPITSFSFTDDEMMSERNIASLHGFFRGAPKTRRRFAPLDVGVRRIGHFGFFRPEMKDALWRPHLVPELAQVS